MESLIWLLIVLVIFGAILYLINHYLPLDPAVKVVIQVVVVIVLLLFLLNFLVGIPGIPAWPRR